MAVNHSSGIRLHLENVEHHVYDNTHRNLRENGQMKNNLQYTGFHTGFFSGVGKEFRKEEGAHTFD